MKDLLANLDIVAADDSEHMRSLYRTVLEAFGAARVRAARDGVEALAMIVESPPDLLVTDWEMGPLDGVALTRHLRDRQRSPAPFLPVLMVSAVADPARVRLARDAGVHDILEKPVAPQNLVEAVRRYAANPVPFIRTRDYFGPDRRRGRRPVPGPERRVPAAEPAS